MFFSFIVDKKSLRTNPIFDKARELQVIWRKS